MSIVFVLVAGVVSALTLDLWQQIVRLLFGVPITNWGMIARWIGHMPQGQFIQEDIGQAAPVANEKPLGWLVHYIVSITLTAIYLFLMQFVFRAPRSFLTAMVYGVATICITWFVIEPALGVGVMGSKAPSPTTVRLLDFTSHLSFGLGIYIGILIAASLHA